ncbi:MAG: crossover junction endodeoxyribonuclease RuvC [Ruminococcaceae bacterium]|nr:crossover junction endodeoxyribonuclease RuvC [Oscillospiraceae bacterium]
MIILGIDPGLATVGWGVVEYKGSKFRTIAYGAILTPKEMTTQARLKKIYDDLADIIRTYRPEQVAIEELFFNTNVTTGIKVSEARGVILLICEQAHLGIFEYTPLQVKQAVVGYGRAEKKQVITMVTMLLGLGTPPKPDDTADALAIAVCHAHSGASRLASYYNK